MYTSISYTYSRHIVTPIYLCKVLMQYSSPRISFEELAIASYPFFPFWHLISLYYLYTNFILHHCPCLHFLFTDDITFSCFLSCILKNVIRFFLLVLFIQRPCMFSWVHIEQCVLIKFLWRKWFTFYSFIFQFSPQVQVIQGSIPGAPYLQQLYQNAQGQIIMPSNLTLQTATGMNTTPIQPNTLNQLNQPLQVFHFFIS